MSSSSTEPSIDWARVERWTGQILANDPTEILAAFPAAAQPSFEWAPDPQAFRSEKLRFLWSYWDSLRGQAAFPRISDIDPLNMRPVLGYVMLLEPVDGDHDFRYRLFGTAVASVSEFEMTGKLASTLEASTSVIEFGVASYRAVFRRKTPLHTVRTPIGAHHIAQWHRLAMPLVDDAGVVTRLIAVSVPLSRDEINAG